MPMHTFHQSELLFGLPEQINGRFAVYRNDYRFIRDGQNMMLLRERRRAKTSYLRGRAIAKLLQIAGGCQAIFVAVDRLFGELLDNVQHY